MVTKARTRTKKVTTWMKLAKFTSSNKEVTVAAIIVLFMIFLVTSAAIKVVVLRITLTETDILIDPGDQGGSDVNTGGDTGTDTGDSGTSSIVEDEILVGQCYVRQVAPEKDDRGVITVKHDNTYFEFLALPYPSSLPIKSFKVGFQWVDENGKTYTIANAGDPLLFELPQGEPGTADRTYKGYIDLSFLDLKVFEQTFNFTLFVVMEWYDLGSAEVAEDNSAAMSSFIYPSEDPMDYLPTTDDVNKEPVVPVGAEGTVQTVSYFVAWMIPVMLVIALLQRKVRRVNAGVNVD